MDPLDEIIARAKTSRPPAQVIDLFPLRAAAPAPAADTSAAFTREEARTLCHSYAALSALVDFTMGGSDELLARVDDMLKLASQRVACIKRLRGDAAG